MDMRIDWKCGYTEDLSHHYRGSLVPNPGQFLQGVKRTRHFSAVQIEEHPRETN
jgi:hypothetical protein